MVRQVVIYFLLVYLLIKLSLNLLVTTTVVKIFFSTMNIIKSPLRNRMKDELLNIYLITYNTKGIFASINNETITK